MIAIILTCSSAANSTGLPTQQPVPARGPLPQQSNPSMRGFADYHAHMFSNRSFGGLLFWGQAFVPKIEPAAMAEALKPCQHTSLKHPVTAAIVSNTPEESFHFPDGYPDFEKWPRYTSAMHQQMYIDWLFRAYQYGLRLVVITATNSEVLCNAAEHTLRCDDEHVVEDQINQIDQMAYYVKTSESGADHQRPWLEIAYSSDDATRIALDNRLAVVIGVEIDNLFECGFGRAGHRCSEAEVERMLDEYHDLGVRQITPVHLAESAFGGNAFYDDRFLANSFYLTGEYQKTRPCPEENVTWRPLGGAGVPAFAKLLEYMNGLGWYSPSYDDPAKSSSACNARGLSDLGKFLIKQMMKRAMLVDMEHMSQLSTDDTLKIAGSAQYPVLVSHAWFRDLKHDEISPSDPDSATEWTDQRSEMHTSANTIAAIRALGGVVGVLTDQGRLDPANEPLKNDCETSSKSVASAYLYAVNAMKGDGGVGLGTDMNGLAEQPGPRFGSNACGEKGPPDHYDCDDLRVPSSDQRTNPKNQDHPVLYDGTTTVNGIVLTRYRAGNRCFDFNYDGLAHYGLLPDLIADLQQVGVSSTDIDVLFRSTAAYISMWKTAKSRAKNIK